MPLLFITRRLHIDHRYRLLICWDLNMHEKETNSKSVCSKVVYIYAEDSWKNARQLLFPAVSLKGANWPGLQPLFDHSMTHDWIPIELAEKEGLATGIHHDGGANTNTRVQWFWHFFRNSICFMWFWFGLEILRLVYIEQFLSYLTF